MLPIRSPTGSDLSGRRCDSQPDLTKSGESTEPSNIQKITFRNKRKHPEENENILVIKEEVNEIKNQMTQMMALLVSLGDSQKDFMNKISQDVTSMKDEISNIRSTTNNIIKDQNKIKSDMSTLLDKFPGTEKKLATLEAEIKLLKVKSNTSTEISLTETIVEEITERDKRGKNLIITGLPEPVSAHKEERSEIDKREILKILNQACADCPEPATIYRLGKYSPTKKRVIKVSFASQKTCINILRNRNSITYSNIKIYSDQTPQQREFLRKLTEELKIRLESGEKDLIIKYVKGVPKITNAFPKN